MEPHISICCGTVNRADSFRRFWRSLVAAATVPTEVLIGDGCNGEWHASYTRELDTAGHIQHISIAYERPRKGMIPGYNALFRQATAPFVAFFNDDAELVPGWDATALRFMRAHEEVGCGCLYWSDPGGRPYVQSLQSIIYPNFGVIRRDVGNAVGWFDEREVWLPETGKKEKLMFYGCDTSIAFSIIDAGYAVVPIPGCLVKHHREQDAEREATMREHLRQGTNIPGAILRELWGGAPGFARLREKHAKFAHLVPRGYFIEDAISEEGFGTLNSQGVGQ